MGLFGSAVFAGWAVSSIFVPRLGDLYGRKWPCFISLVIASVMHLGIVISTNMTLTVLMFFIFGSCCAGRFSLAYVYLCELVPEKYNDIVGAFLLCADAANFLILAVYFRFISKDWLPF